MYLQPYYLYVSKMYCLSKVKLVIIIQQRAVDFEFLIIYFVRVMGRLIMFCNSKAHLLW